MNVYENCFQRLKDLFDLQSETRNNPQVDKVKEIINQMGLGNPNLFAVYPTTLESIRNLLTMNADQFPGQQAEIFKILEKLKKFKTEWSTYPIMNYQVRSSAVLYISKQMDDEDEAMSEDDSDLCDHWPDNNLARWDEEQLCSFVEDEDNSETI